MVLVLSRDEVRDLLDMPAVINMVEAALVQSSLGQTIQPVRLRLYVPRYQSRIVSMPAYLQGADAMGIKITAGAAGNADLGLPSVMAKMILCDPTSGSFLALMDGAYLTAVRTAAASAVATRYLALPNARVLGIIGAGAQARAHLWALSTVRPIATVKAFDLSPERARDFQREMEERFGLPVEVHDTAETVVRESDVVVTVTTSRTPVLSGVWLREGTHINAVGAFFPDARELDTDAVARATVVTDSLDALLAEAGDVLIPMSEGRITREHIRGEIGEIVAGRKPGRMDKREITVFKSLGIAAEDVAVANLAYRRAKERGLGIEVDV